MQEDSLVGGKGEDVLKGQKGTDQLSGNAGADLLEGGKGADTLKGGKGQDSLNGGKGRDLFVLGKGNDVVADFDAKRDAIQLESDADYELISEGRDVLIKQGNQTHRVLNSELADIRKALRATSPLGRAAEGQRAWMVGLV